MAYIDSNLNDASLWFRVKTYEGNSSNDHAITWDETHANMQPDLLWFKSRDNAQSHALWDSVRGASLRLIPNSSGAEGTEATNLDSFDSNGFQVDNEAIVNHDSMVAWGWKESATAGFDIVGHTGTSSAHTISHSLSAVPHLIISKNRDGTQGWGVYHHKNTSAPETDFLALNTNDATSDQSTFWNDTAPTSSVFSVGTSGWVNDTGNDYIVYLFSEKQGFSKFGTYTGNANNDGAFIYLGFKPSFFMVKKTDATDDWRMFDNKRPGRNVIDDELKANENGAEGTGDKMDFLSNGVKFRISTSVNTSNTFVYMAFAEAPFVNSKGVPANAE
jgi:hypothetical protein